MKVERVDEHTVPSILPYPKRTVGHKICGAFARHFSGMEPGTTWPWYLQHAERLRLDNSATWLCLKRRRSCAMVHWLMDVNAQTLRTMKPLGIFSEFVHISAELED